MIGAVIGQKINQSQMFLEDGTRIPVTRVNVAGNTVIYLKNKNKHGYNAIQLGFGMTKKVNKAILGQIKGTNLKSPPRFFKEVKISDFQPEQLPKPGDSIKISEVLKPGDIVDVIGVSKGKGFAGVVKRHHFQGGPRTHGQSDRERAPGSIGQTTTPGRVYKGKRMAGKMGHKNVTVKNLTVVDISNDLVLIKGLIPGPLNNIIVIEKIGENKKFVPLYKEETKEEKIGENKTVSGSEEPEEVKKEEKTESTEKKTKEEEVEPSFAKASDGKEENAN